MNKKDKKQFPPGFFDKPSEETGLLKQSFNWLYLHWKSFLLFSIATICVVFLIVFIPKKCGNNNTTDIQKIISKTPSKNPDTPVTVNSYPGESEQPKTSKKAEEVINDKTTTEKIGKTEDSLETAALSVIRGNYGNNPERKRKLGDRYQEIQNRVNQMYREGKVRKRR